VPGIDFAGTVLASKSALWQTGDEVVLNGWAAGEDWWGGLAQQARAKGEWLIRKPSTFTPYETMAVGTAGYTAALCVAAIERHGVGPSQGDVIVTGATGGVGSIAILLLSARGYRVVASTGKLRDTGYLRDLGASDVIDRATLAQPGKPLQKERWAAAVDTIGSHTLANVCASTRSNGIVTACGLAQGMDLPATVAPFILRGVTLAGINSVMVPIERRLAAWEMLERLIDRSKLRSLSREVGLSEAIGVAPRFLAGEIAGRLVVNVAR
jgi:acrylyl-CoA reductase (NADPH)